MLMWPGLGKATLAWVSWPTFFYSVPTTSPNNQGLSPVSQEEKEEIKEVGNLESFCLTAITSQDFYLISSAMNRGKPKGSHNEATPTTEESPWFLKHIVEVPNFYSIYNDTSLWLNLGLHS